MQILSFLTAHCSLENDDCACGTLNCLEQVEHDIMNYQNRGLCYLPQPSASADNTDLGFDNS